MSRYFIFGVFFLFFSCRDLVETTPASITPKPVLNSLLKAGNPVAVHLSLTRMMDAKQIKGIQDATVELFIDEDFVELMQYEEGGWFVSDAIAHAGKSYSFRVQIHGHEIVSAHTKIPEPYALLNIEHIAIAGREEQGETYPAVHFTFENNPGNELFFNAHIRLFSSGSYEGIGQLKNIIDPVLLNEGIPLLLFSNEKIKDDKYTMIVNYTTGSHSGVGDGQWVTNLYPFIIELRSVSKEYYQYNRQKYLYETGRFPEFGIGANIAFPLFSNVEGGYGIVASYSSFVSDTIYPSY